MAGRCHTLDGTQIRPAEAIAAALVGHVRRVVVDSAGTVIDLGRRQRLFRGGPTDIDNSDAYCGFHNRTKEHGFRPVRDPDGTWSIHRPDDDGPITPPV